MTDQPPPHTNWSGALGEIQCPKCGATSRPGASYYEQQQDGSYVCIVCAKPFSIPRRKASWTPG